MTEAFDKAVRAGCGARPNCRWPSSRCRGEEGPQLACFTPSALEDVLASLAEPDDATIEVMTEANCPYKKGTFGWSEWQHRNRAAWAAGIAAIRGEK
jgi:hypothetical protein